MKEITFEDWKGNPTPRMMWVWDCDVRNKKRKKVIYLTKEKKYPVITVTDDDYFCSAYAHCAEIKEPRRMTNREFSWWLLDGIRDGKHREWKYRDAISVHNLIDYVDNEKDLSVDEDVVVRENGGEWHEPLVEE